MLTFANAKINLGLNITRRRPDGYHDLQTIFYPAGKECGTPACPGRLCDIVEIAPSRSAEDSLLQLGLKADCDPQKNLVMKALRRFRQCALGKGITVPPQQIVLEKHIPFGAGIGGGSADATATLLLLNEIFGGPFDTRELLVMANSLGADCPFFVLNRPALAMGTGELLTPLSLDLSRYSLALVKPDVSISTREAFSRVTPREPRVPLADIARMPIECWREVMSNDFEESAFALHPELRRLKETLYDAGALYASMSGSGSSFFGIYPDEAAARAAIARCGTPYGCVTRLIP